ncbi:unnamed protein product [Cladocopium goreaui]|uniref:Dynein heavy chain 7, axonemal n=1 Tax=Cladocopium goreaui TaxID=2562237 RepID=A0A9P1BJW7_9DINO|nr:unnamed protein product [Cladocopium goreaui]
MASSWTRMGQLLLVVAKFTDGDYQRLEGCIQFGNPIENVEDRSEETDPVEPVLLQMIQGKRVGLQDQLLKERPDLAEEKARLVEGARSNWKSLRIRSWMFSGSQFFPGQHP